MQKSIFYSTVLCIAQSML